MYKMPYKLQEMLSNLIDKITDQSVQIIPWNFG